MISWLLSMFGGVKTAIFGAVSLLGGLYGLVWKWRCHREKTEKEKYQQANKTYQAKEKIQKQDRALEAAAEQNLETVREKVNNAESPEKAVQAVAEGLNKFCGIARKQEAREPGKLWLTWRHK